MKSNYRIGFIGAGNMGSCLIQGLLKQGYPAEQLWVSDHHPATLQALEKEGVHTHLQNGPVAANVDILVLAIKPNVMKATITELAAHFKTHRPVIVSVAAGITTTQITKWLLKTPCPVVRAMPNTPALIRLGMTGLFAAPNMNPSLHHAVTELFQAVGEITWLGEESLMDVVTALSGSGPAYFFYFIECLTAAGVTLGLSAETARKLTLQTALGAAHLALQSPDAVSTLRQKVTSKGGTTEQGINTLKDGKMAELLQQMLSAATIHGKTLREQYDEEI